MKIAIIGAGFAGLSTACYLARSGHEIVVYEKQSIPGGRAGLIERDGYRIDTGPSVLTMIGYLEAAVEAAGSRLSDLVDLIKVDPAYRALYSDGSTPAGAGEIRVYSDQSDMYSEIERTCSRQDADGYVRLATFLANLYETEFPHFISRNFASPFSMAKPVAPLMKLMAMGALGKLDHLIAKYLKDERLRRLFTFQAMYAGLSPLEAMGVYSIIAYMDNIQGVYFPKGGMNAAAVALEMAAESAGVRFEFNSAVARVLRGSGNSGPVKAIELESGGRREVDAIVITAELGAAYRELLAPTAPKRSISSSTYSPSCFLWLIGARSERPSDSTHHNIYFGERWKDSFDQLLKDGTRMSDPSYLVSIPNVTDPDLAPVGGQIYYVLEPVPNLDGKVDWTYESDRITESLREKLLSSGYLQATSQIEVERRIDPLEWQRMGMERGTPFAASHKFFQSGPFRTQNFDARLPNVFFAGSSTIPGVGVPMVLVSGRLAAERVLGHLGGA